MDTATVVVPKKPNAATNKMTTTGGVLLVVGIIIEELRVGGFPQDLSGWVAFATKIIGASFIAWWARDKNVTSEGEKIKEVPA